MAKAVTANPDFIQLPDALTLPTRELVEEHVQRLREGLTLLEKQAVAENRDAVDGLKLKRTSRFLYQLEHTLPPVPDDPAK